MPTASLRSLAKRGGSVERASGDGDGHAFGGAAVVGAAGRRHVAIVATDGNFDVVLVGHQVVGRIEATPAMRRRKRLDPGVGRAQTAARGMLLGAAALDDVAARVPRWNADGATQAQ